MSDEKLQENALRLQSPTKQDLLELKKARKAERAERRECRQRMSVPGSDGTSTPGTHSLFGTPPSTRAPASLQLSESPTRLRTVSVTVSRSGSGIITSSLGSNNFDIGGIDEIDDEKFSLDDLPPRVDLTQLTQTQTLATFSHLPVVINFGVAGRGLAVAEVMVEGEEEEEEGVYSI